MVNCAVIGCTNNSSRNNRVAYHKLPCEKKYPDLRRAWLERIAREDPDEKRTFILRKNCYVCSDHFEEDDYGFSVNFLLTHMPHQRTNRVLKKGSIPSKNLILKSARRQRVEKSKPQVSAVNKESEGVPSGPFITGSAFTFTQKLIPSDINVNQYADHVKTEQYMDQNGSDTESRIGEEYGQYKENPTMGISNKRPTKRKLPQNSGRSPKQVQDGKAFHIEAFRDVDVVKSEISDVKSNFESDFEDCDDETYEEPSDDMPPLPICKITEDAATQCEMGHESIKNTLKTTRSSEAKENPKIRAENLSFLSEKLKKKKKTPRPISPSDFIVCVVDGGVQCEIGKEIYKNVL